MARRPGLIAAVALALAVTPALAGNREDAVAAQISRARIALARGDGVGAEAALERALGDGAAESDLRHLFAHAALIMERPERALDLADAERVPARFAAYAARMRGRAQVALGDQAAASAEFDRAAILAPRDPEAWVDIGRFRMTADNVAGAIEAADRAVALAPAKPDILLLKGELVRIQYGLVAALPWFERALAIDPHHAPALLEAAATLGEIGRARDMLAMTRRLLVVDSRNAGAFYLQAVLAARAGRYDLARRLLQRAGDALDDLPGAALLRAVLDIQAGNWEQAITGLQKLRTLQPDNAKVTELLATAMWRAGDDRGAAMIVGPLADAPDASGYALAIVGRVLEEGGDRAVAARYLDRAAGALREDAVIRPQPLQAAVPGSPMIFVEAGDALAAEGRFTEAADSYRRAANLDFSENIALRLIDALRRANNPGTAERVLRLFLAQNPRNIAAQRLAAAQFGQQRAWASAIPILEGLRQRLGGRDAGIQAALATAYRETGRTKEALAAARHAYALAPFDPAVTGSYGSIALKIGDRRSASALLEKARALAADPL